MSITRLRDEDREFMLTQILGQREAPPTATEVLRKARIEHGSSMHFQSRRDRIFQAQPSSARVQFGTEEDQTVAINGDGVAPDEPTQLALDVPKHFSIKHASHKFGSVLAGNAIFTSTIDGDTDDRSSTDDTPTAPSNRWHVAPFPIRIALEKDPHEPAGSGSESVTAASLGGGARSRSQAGGARSMSQFSVERLAEPNRQHGVSGGGGGGDGGAGLEREEGEEQELQGPHSELVDRADEALNTARSKLYRRGSLDAADSSFKRSEPVYAMTATKFMANLPAGASESGGAVVGGKHVDANSRDAWAAAAATAGVQVSGASFSGASASGGINGVRAPPVRRASQVSYGDYSGAAAAAAAAAAATACSAGGVRHGASETLATTASINSSAGARFMMPAPPPPRAASHNLGAVSSTSRRSSVVGEPASGELSGGGTATFSSCGESGALSSASPPRMLSRGPSALSMGIPDPCASGSASGHLHGHSWKQQQQQRSEATYGGAGLIGGISTEKEAANTLGLLAKVAHTELRPAAPQLWTVEPYQASGVAALSAAAASATGGALAPQPPPAGRTGPSRTASSAAIGTNRRLSSSALGLLGSRAHRATLDGEGWAEPASPAGSATSAAAGDVTSGAYSRVAARRNSITDGHGGLGGRSGGGGGDDEGAELLPAQAGAPHGGPLRGGADAPRVPRGVPTRNASCIGNTDTSMAMPPGSGATADAPRPAARRRGSIDEPLLMQQLGGGVGVSIMGGRRRSMEEVPQTSMSRFVPSVFTAEAALAAAAAAAAASPNSHGQLSSGLLPAIAPRVGAMSSGSQQRLPSIVSAPASADGVCIGSHGSVEGGGGSISSQARLQAHRSSRHQLHHFSGHCKLATPEPTALLPGHYNPYAGKSVVTGGGANDAMEAAAAHARSECFAHLPTPAAVLLDATSAVAMRAGGGAAAADGGALAAPRPVTPATGGRRLSASFINAYAGLGGTGGDVSAGSHNTRERFNPLADVSPADIGAISSSNGGGAARAATSGSGGRRFSGEFQRPHAPPPTYSHGSLATHQSGLHGTHNAGDGAAAAATASAAAAGDAGSGGGGGGGEAGAAGAEGMMQKLRGAFSGLLHKGNSKGYGQSRT